jgi:DNA-directed RNA polymerase subunit M/transcription elongation factor TFIIS
MNTNDFQPNIKIPLELYKDITYNNIRRSYILILSSLLEKYDDFKILSNEQKQKMIIDIELSCYNYIINKSKDLGYIVEWNNNQFEYLYRITISKITKHIDMDSEVHDKLDNTNKYYLVKNIMNNNIPIPSIPYLSSYQLCPAKSEKINQQLKTRTQQKITYKTSTLYTCKNCKKREVKIIEYQGRSLDESSNLSLTCVYCGFHWVN